MDDRRLIPDVCNTTSEGSAGAMRHYRGEYAAHDHSFAQVLIGRRGLLTLELNGRHVLLDEATAVVVPATCSHAYQAAGQADVLVLDTRLEALDRVRVLKQPPAWRFLDQYVTSAAVFRELESLVPALSRRAIDVEGLRSRIAAQPRQPWSVARMASIAHMSVPQFHARFRELARTTPGEFLRDIRVTEARRLLVDGHSLTFAAAAVGYCSGSALSYAMRQAERRR